MHATLVTTTAIGGVFAHILLGRYLLDLHFQIFRSFYHRMSHWIANNDVFLFAGRAVDNRLDVPVIDRADLTGAFDGFLDFDGRRLHSDMRQRVGDMLRTGPRRDRLNRLRWALLDDRVVGYVHGIHLNSVRYYVTLVVNSRIDLHFLFVGLSRRDVLLFLALILQVVHVIPLDEIPLLLEAVAGLWTRP